MPALAATIRRSRSCPDSMNASGSDESFPVSDEKMPPKSSKARLPTRFRKRSTLEATKRLVATSCFLLLALHTLSLAPNWALPFAWIFTTIAFTFVFEIAHDCCANQFFVSSTANAVCAAVLLTPLLQPTAFWMKPRQAAKDSVETEDEETDDDRKRPQSVGRFSRLRTVSSWFQGAFNWATLAEKLHYSHFLVIGFALAFFPFMLAMSDGLWLLTKYWLLPFMMFNVWMYTFFLEGQRINAELALNMHLVQSDHTEPTSAPSTPLLTKDGAVVSNGVGKNSAAQRSRPKPSTFRLYLRLLAYLRFHLHVPSYHFSDALYFVKRMWSRQYDETPTGKTFANGVPNFLETLAYGPYKQGLAKLKFLDSALSLLLKFLVGVWLLLTVASHMNVDLSELHFQLRTLSWTAAKQEVMDLGSRLIRFYSSPGEVAMDLPMALVSGVILFLIVRRYYQQKPVYLVDFVTYHPPSSLTVPTERFKTLQRQLPFSDDALDFMDRLILRTGIGESSYFPPGIIGDHLDFSIRSARAEAEMVMFGCIDELFNLTNTSPKDIDILVVNCSLFCPTPSLSAMIVNKYKMREDIQSYNLGGMGCSAGVISIHLAKDLLTVHPNSLALVVSTENITQNWFRGNERGMLISNTLFRMGGAAVLLSNKSSDRSRSKYRLLHTIRTHRGADDESYSAVYQDCEAGDAAKSEEGQSPVSAASDCETSITPPPSTGNSKQQVTVPLLGVRLSKDLMRVAGEALKHNITSLAPLILPWSEQLRYLFSLVQRKVFKRKTKLYVPNFKKAVQHFCIHAGGRAVIEAIEQNLQLEPRDVEPSKATLHRWGNTSSSSIWYELAWLEKEGRIRNDDRVWQIAFGSGFKCNSAVWQAN